MRGLSPWFVVVWGLAFTVLVLDAAVSFYNIEVLSASDQAVAHARDVTRVLDELRLSVKDAEIGARGFAISEDETYVTSFRLAEATVPVRLARLQELTRDNPYYDRRLELLTRQINRRFAILSQNIDAHRAGGLKATRIEIAKDEGKEAMAQIGNTIGELEAHSDEILAERSRVANDRYRSSRITAMMGGVLTVVMVGVAFIMVRVELSRRQKAEIESRQAALQLAEEQKRRNEMLATMVNIRTAELESANQLLREEITERTRAEARAQSTAVELKRSNEDLETFAYVASHDLQEPLRKIQAFGDRLVKKYREILGSDGAEYVDRMQSAATRMRTLINDLLTFSRVTTKGHPFVTVDLAEIVREVIDDLDEPIQQTSAQIDVGELPRVNADAMQMRQLFQNLIGNALKFLKSDVTPVITIRATAWEKLTTHADPRTPSGSGNRITVEDNGIGFDQTYAERVFELFQRLHGKGEYEGTGIGLAICRKIVQRHGGQIVARGRPGEGATFVIDLPADPVASFTT